jgi:hypothetical protein
MTSSQWFCKCGHDANLHVIDKHRCDGSRLAGFFDNRIESCKCREFKPDLDTYYRMVYLPLHSKTGTKLWHFIGLQATILFVLVCVVMQWWWALLSAPFVVYLFAWPSHKYIERNKPAAFKNPVYAKLSDLRMCLEMLTGELD